MKSIILFIFVIGVVMLALGYQRELLNTTKVEEHVEYRYIPSSIYEEQFGKPNLTRSFRDMFETSDIYMNRPYL